LLLHYLLTYAGGVLNSKSVVTVCVYHKRHGKLGLELDEFIGHTHIPLSSLDVCDNKERIRYECLRHRLFQSCKWEFSFVSIIFLL